MIPFADHCARVERYLQETAGIRVVTREIPAHLIGDLDGCEIHIDNRATPEQRLFLLGHLFGHTLQWNTDPEAFELGRIRTPPVEESLLPAIMAYEREAACYALGMLNRVGITGLAQWFSDYTACDMAYLLHYYRTGEKEKFARFWQDLTELIEAKPAPLFTPLKQVFRLPGVVI
jgi:hypothetical protein